MYPGYGRVPIPAPQVEKLKLSPESILALPEVNRKQMIGDFFYASIEVCDHDFGIDRLTMATGFLRPISPHGQSDWHVTGGPA